LDKFYRGADIVNRPGNAGEQPGRTISDAGY